MRLPRPANRLAGALLAGASTSAESFARSGRCPNHDFRIASRTSEPTAGESPPPFHAATQADLPPKFGLDDWQADNAGVFDQY